MHLDWRFRETLSAIHAAWCVGCVSRQLASPEPAEMSRSGASPRPLTLNPMLQALLEPSQALWDFADSVQPAGNATWNSTFWLQAANLAAQEEGLPEYSQRILKNCGSDVSNSAPLAQLLRDVKLAFARDFPEAARQMQVRKDPLVQLWQAQGPGLLFGIGKQTWPDLLVESAEIALLQPIVAGCGVTHMTSNRVQFEAVLTNENPVLPETLRLAWHLSQLDLERPLYSEHLNSRRLRLIGGLAMIPPTLVVAEDLGLSTYQPETIENAISEWFRPLRIEASAEAARCLVAWWETFAASRPKWVTALTGLDRMLGETLQLR